MSCRRPGQTNEKQTHRQTLMHESCFRNSAQLYWYHRNACWERLSWDHWRFLFPSLCHGALSINQKSASQWAAAPTTWSAKEMRSKGRKKKRNKKKGNKRTIVSIINERGQRGARVGSTWPTSCSFLPVSLSSALSLSLFLSPLHPPLRKRKEKKNNNN